MFVYIPLEHIELRNLNGNLQRWHGWNVCK